MDGPVINFKTEDGKPFDDWPLIGETLRDKRGPRRFLVVQVNKRSPLGRNVVGIVDGNSYACDAPTLVAQWGR